MNEEMKKAWLEISQMLGYPTQQQQDVFLRTWQRAIQAEREECAKICDRYVDSSSDHEAGTAMNIQAAIRARGQA